MEDGIMSGLTLKRFISTLIVSLFLYACYQNINIIREFSQKYMGKFKMFESTSSKTKRNIVQIKLKFTEDWTQMMMSRLDASGIHLDCNMNWKKENAMPWFKKTERTDTEKSYITKWKINPAGEFSRIVLQTQFTNGKIKHKGGDYWRVYVQGRSSVPVLKTDLGNGSYEFMFLPLSPGEYRLGVSLEYTLCDGIKEPPPDWFVKGNVQGKEQKHGILLHDMPYINKSLWSGADILFKVPLPRLNAEDRAALLTKSCQSEQSRCKYLWNGFGSWLNRSIWQPFCPEHVYPRYPRKREGILWIFGDSVSSQFYHIIKKNRICKQIFRTCMYSYNWIYSLENYNLTLGTYVRRNSTIEKRLWDDRDFSVEKVIEELKQALFHPAMDEKSVLLLNYGLHYTEATNYTNFKKLIEQVKILRHQIKCKIVWRTTTSLNRHKYSMPNLHSRRFMTSQRVQLYNAYATNEFCKAGFDVLDIYPLTDSYPFGTGSGKTPHDPVHYEYHVMKPMEKVLERVFET